MTTFLLRKVIETGAWSLERQSVELILKSILRRRVVGRYSVARDSFGSLIICSVVVRDVHVRCVGEMYTRDV